MKDSLLISMLLVLLCLFGSGCCTINVMSFSYKYFHDTTSVEERKATVSEDGKYLEVNVRIGKNHNMPRGVLNWHYHKSKTFKFPLTFPPSFAEKFILDVDVKDITNDRASSFDLNIGDSEIPIFLVKRYVTQTQDIATDHQINIELHPDDMPKLNKPFVIYLNYYKGRERHTAWREDVMIPYKREGNRFFIYSAANRKSNNVILLGKRKFDDSLNAGTLLCWTLAVPPALALDIVTLPFWAVGGIIYGIGIATGMGP